MKGAVLKQFLLILITVFFLSCKGEVGFENQNTKAVVAEINNNKILIAQVDSLISPQLFELRMNALEMFISKSLIESEAKTQNISVENLVEKEIINKSKEVTDEDIRNYIRALNIEHVDSNNIIQQLANLRHKERQDQYVDSLKDVYPLKIALQPSYFNKADTSGIYSHNITENSSEINVYIVSDFKCHSCQKAEKKLKHLYEKYNKIVNFKFVYFSGYIDDAALACEASAKQDKFKNMHDIIFENSDALDKISIYNDLAKNIGLDINRFKSDMQDKTILRKLLKNKDLLASNKIYSTPTFIVNNKILDGKYAIVYLENVIIDELNARK